MDQSVAQASAVAFSHCVVCDANAAAVLFRGSLSRHQLLILRCRSCEHVYLNGWGGTFDEDMYGYYSARVDLSRDYVYDPLNTKRHVELLDSLSTKVAGRRLLDVGCGEGQFVASASEAGWDSLGIDLASGAVQVAQKFGVNCRSEDFFAQSLSDERFDLISMFEFIEHVPHPTRFLKRARELLVPGGLLYLTTPNFASAARRIMKGAWPVFHPEHFSYFTPVQLSELVRDAGLEVVLVETRNLDPQAVLHIIKNSGRFAAPSPNVTQESHATPAGSDAVLEKFRASTGQRARRLVEGSAVLRATKRALNRAISMTDFGDTIVLTARRTTD
jgi:2-polyprenyl-3-methyl-5-hydroxy-6-metoxy-1,4-benzoquinol methylase